jgi:hypothetical protein
MAQAEAPSVKLGAMRRTTTLAPWTIASTLALLSCDGTPPVDETRFPPHCENINPLHCLLPWPSSRWLVEDESTGTRLRIQIPADALPRTRRGRIPVAPELFSRFDGFSPATSIITAYPGDVDPGNLPDERHIADSLAPDSPTVILDAETGERVAHFAERDEWPDMDPLRRPIYLRPATRLAENRRYLVAIRNLRYRDGTPVEPSDWFRAIRDRTPLPQASDLESRRDALDDVLERLEAAGIERASLIEAWDFHTATGETAWGELVSIRDQALRAVASDPMPRCTIESVEEAPDDRIWRRVHGRVRVPLFLRGTDPMSFEESRFLRDDSGRPVQNGFADVPFVLLIPRSVRDRVAAGGAPARLLDYGHGLFGSRFETDARWFRDTIAELEMVGVAIDWWGMSNDDLPRVALSLQEFSTFDATVERLDQALINHVVLHRSFSDRVPASCTALPELQIPLDAGGTAPAIDATQRYYYGNSQGGIMGGALAGIAVDVQRFVLGVGGMTYSLMIPRSTNWTLYGSIMANGYADPLERAILLVMSQSQWDRAEPSGVVTHVLRDTLPCAEDICPGGRTPAHFVLAQIGRDDAQVANIASDLAARSMGAAGYASPSPYEPWGLRALSAARGEPLGPDALVIYDIPGTPVLPLGTRQVEDNPAHEGVRRSAAAIEQIDRFLQPDGVVYQTCDGVCDPT